ncbi:unnamed protein product, partial [Pleuronectes platessa]
VKTFMTVTSAVSSQRGLDMRAGRFFPGVILRCHACVPFIEMDKAFGNSPVIRKKPLRRRSLCHEHDDDSSKPFDVAPHCLAEPQEIERKDRGSVREVCVGGECDASETHIRVFWDTVHGNELASHDLQELALGVRGGCAEQRAGISCFRKHEIK